MNDARSLLARYEEELALLNSKLTVAEKGRHEDVSKEAIASDQERLAFLKQEISRLKSEAGS